MVAFFTPPPFMGAGIPSEATSLFAKMSTQPDDAQKTLYINLISSLKSAGVWTKLDYLYLFAAHTAQASLLNLTGNFNALIVGSQTFTTNRGYAGAANAGKYIDTGFNPTTASSPKFTQNSANIMCWSRSTTANNFICGTSSGTTTSIDPSSGSAAVCGGGTAAASPPNASGCFLGVRENSSTVRIYRNGSLLASNTSSTSAALPNTTHTFGKAGIYGFTGNYCAGCAGSSLTSTEAAALYSALYTYLHAVGAV